MSTTIVDLRPAVILSADLLWNKDTSCGFCENGLCGECVQIRQELVFEIHAAGQAYLESEFIHTLADNAEREFPETIDRDELVRWIRDHAEEALKDD